MGEYVKYLNMVLTENKKEVKQNYKIYHTSYTSAVDEILNYIKKNGYDISDDEVWSQISTGKGRPKNGSTLRHDLELLKDGIRQKKMLHAQIYDMQRDKGNSYELNMYIS